MKSGALFANELTFSVKNHKMEILKCDITSCLSFFDLMTKKSLLLFYVRSIKKTNLFKEQNEYSLFNDSKMKDMLGKHYAFSGFEASIKGVPMELVEFRVTPIDVPSLLVFHNQGGMTPALIYKTGLKNVDSLSKEQVVISELFQIQDKIRNPKRLKSPELKKQDLIEPEFRLPKSKITRSPNSKTTSIPEARILRKVEEPKVQPKVEQKKPIKIPKYAFSEENYDDLIKDSYDERRFEEPPKPRHVISKTSEVTHERQLLNKTHRRAKS